VNKLYLVLEYMRRGDLMHVLKGDNSTNSCQPLGDLEVWRILRQVSQGLKYLHTQVRHGHHHHHHHVVIIIIIIIIIIIMFMFFRIFRILILILILIITSHQAPLYEGSQ
jgi:serine/threonine protein kinase